MDLRPFLALSVLLAAGCATTAPDYCVEEPSTTAVVTSPFPGNLSAIESDLRALNWTVTEDHSYGVNVLNLTRDGAYGFGHQTALGAPDYVITLYVGATSPPISSSEVGGVLHNLADPIARDLHGQATIRPPGKHCQ